MHRIFNYLMLLFAASAISPAQAQPLSFAERSTGEVLTYFSPYREFANQSLLTRANGHSPIEFTAGEAPADKPATYRFLIGHSTGTSSGERDFDVDINDQRRFTFHTVPKMAVGAVIEGVSEDGTATYRFECIEQDINRDAFGFLSITLAKAPAGKPVFRITGRNHESRDWLMVFMYREGWKMNVFPTALVLREGRKRQVNFSIDSPWPDGTMMEIISGHGFFRSPLRQGYQNFAIPIYAENYAGTDTLSCFVNGQLVDTRILVVSPARPYTFHILHHSHNDIGYSHLQTEVAKIQSANLRSALRWITAARARGHDAFWHVESLWAVENFLRDATPEEEAAFVQAVRDGHLVLSANYANVLTGLAQPEELDWMTEYARQLESRYGFRIENAMITDIPGISYWGLKRYVEQRISYLSLGPNYVESFPDRGDRVGGVIRETGDKMFYWKPSAASRDSVLVWTAGKGYSYFHNIQDGEKQFKWEQKLSNYVQELADKGYPFDEIQLRYTKNADNGPVDTLLDVFVADWNDHFASPTLVISSATKLFEEFAARHSREIPVQIGGEVSPYWEDGAYSTAQEENDSRRLVRRTLAMEAWARSKHLHEEIDWYPLHRFLVLWHEHTWGAWCSISDPEIFFTTAQWRIKKSFLDSAQVAFHEIANRIGYGKSAKAPAGAKQNEKIKDFTVDPASGGLTSIAFADFAMPWAAAPHSPFQLVYAEGTTDPKTNVPRVEQVKTLRDDGKRKEVEVISSMPYFPGITTTYALDKKGRNLEIRFVLQKTKNINKESLHLCIPVAHEEFSYGNETESLRYPADQLPGSNYEFICTPKWLHLRKGDVTYHMETPDVALVEMGAMIDEHQTLGAKTWKRTPQATSPMYLYILNNYWHTNYKAYQEGMITFSLTITAEKGSVR